jgi:hypothetical protein
MRSLFGLLLLVPGTIGADLPPSCFICDQWSESSGFIYHRDWELILSDSQGNKHGGTTLGSCAEMHSAYGNTPQ